MVLVQIGLFFIFLLDNLGQKNMFYDILDRTKAFLEYKNKNFGKSNN